jgi:opacity protein-like surface antigen
MHIRPRLVLALCVAALGIAAGSASAQAVPRVEVSGGYQFLNLAIEGESESMPAGWYADVAGTITPMLAVVFQVGGNYKSFDESVTVGGLTATATADLKVHEFLGGVRFNFRSQSAIVPFAQVLAGGINGSADVSVSAALPGIPPIAFDEEVSGTNFALGAGGGVNFGLTDTVGVRVGADYLHAFEDEAGANLFRFHVGVVFAM